MGGVQAAGTYVIMGDAVAVTTSRVLTLFVERLREGNDLVVGNRFLGGIRPGAMPALHRYVGNPRTSSWVGRRFFHVAIGDFHCGLRGFRRSSLLALDLRTSGMEFASEVIVKAQLAGQRITEVPTVLHPDGRTRKPHLRSFCYGWRHLGSCWSTAHDGSICIPASSCSCLESRWGHGLWSDRCMLGVSDWISVV